MHTPQKPRCKDFLTFIILLTAVLGAVWWRQWNGGMKVICPNCKTAAIIPARATFNADQYGNSCNTVLGCCGAIVRLTPIRSYRLEMTDAVEDDWGYAARKRMA